MPSQGRLQQQAKCRWLAWALLLAAIVLLSGCFDALPTDDGIARQRVARVFADPAAQKLAFAAERGNAAEVTRLMKQERLNPDTMFGKDGMPVVAWPVARGNLVGLKALLDNGANPNVATPAPRQPDRRESNWNNALVLATMRDEVDYLTLLLERGGDPNARDVGGESLLSLAFINDNKDAKIRLLIEHGADPNADTGSGATIITQYADFGAFWMVWYLLQHGADPELHYGFHGKQRTRDSYAIQAIFWYPAKPQFQADQRKCQQWLLQRGYTRPPLEKGYRELRQSLGKPTSEQDVPLL